MPNDAPNGMQVEGVKFLYETIMGLHDPGRSGCILADEMVGGRWLGA